MVKIIKYFTPLRYFYKLSIEDAKVLKLKFKQNIYGDLINLIDCRSIWVDSKNREYFIKKNLYYE